MSVKDGQPNNGMQLTALCAAADAARQTHGRPTQTMRRHPYEWRTRLRGRLPWFLINMGFAAKGRDCEAIGAEHHWYNRDDKSSGCYHCEVVRDGQLWKRGAE